MLTMHLITTWRKICRALGVEFEQYLPTVMSLLVHVVTTGAPSLGCFGFATDWHAYQKLNKLLRGTSGSYHLIPKH